MTLKRLFQTPLAQLWADVGGWEKKRDAIQAKLEEQLILADVDTALAKRLAKEVLSHAGNSALDNGILSFLQAEIFRIFEPLQKRMLRIAEKAVWVLVGVNGCGKTTTAAKLAYHYQRQGKRVLLSAADTFRAAGAAQLALWGERLGIPVVAGERGEDPGAVVYRSMQRWQSQAYELLLIDTAGRIQSKDNLMRELAKLVNVIKKISPARPDETLLVLDAGTGQQALAQAEKFKEFSGISGIVLAKLDGTAKGGAVISIADKMKLPVRFVGTGEEPTALEEFVVGDFLRALLAPA